MGHPMDITSKSSFHKISRFRLFNSWTNRKKYYEIDKNLMEMIWYVEELLWANWWDHVHMWVARSFK